MIEIDWDDVEETEGALRLWKGGLMHQLIDQSNANEKAITELKDVLTRFSPERSEQHRDKLAELIYVEQCDGRGADSMLRERLSDIEDTIEKMNLKFQTIAEIEQRLKAIEGSPSPVTDAPKGSWICELCGCEYERKIPHCGAIINGRKCGGRVTWHPQENERQDEEKTIACANCGETMKASDPHTEKSVYLCPDCDHLPVGIIDQLSTSLPKLDNMPNENVDSCEWREDIDGNWETGCDNAFICSDGTPAENEMAYCPYCGRKLKEIRYGEDEPIEPITSQSDCDPSGMDALKPKGSWICNECGKDWGNGAEIGITPHGMIRRNKLTAYCVGGCGKDAVTWHPQENETPDETVNTYDPQNTKGKVFDTDKNTTDPDTQELKPCSQCDRTDAAVTKDDEQVAFSWQVICGNCGMRTDNYTTKEYAIEAWNTRPIEDRLRDEIKRLRVDWNNEVDKLHRQYQGALAYAQDELDEACDEIDQLKSDLAEAQAKIERVKQIAIDRKICLAKRGGDWSVVIEKYLMHSPIANKETV